MATTCFLSERCLLKGKAITRSRLTEKHMTEPDSLDLLGWANVYADITGTVGYRIPSQSKCMVLHSKRQISQDLFQATFLTKLVPLTVSSVVCLSYSWYVYGTCFQKNALNSIVGARIRRTRHSIGSKSDPIYIRNVCEMFHGYMQVLTPRLNVHIATKAKPVGNKHPLLHSTPGLHSAPCKTSSQKFACRHKRRNFREGLMSRT